MHQIGLVKVEEGVYFIRGQFVRCASKVDISSSTSEMLGWIHSQRGLLTPELDRLTDNATGTQISGRVVID